jgi:aminoglycoside phosphotransferase
VLRHLHSIQPPADQGRSYVVPDPDPVKNKGLQEVEEHIIFSEQNADPDVSLMHNDFTLSNTIVDNDKIVGLVDWEMAGWFGWQTAAEVHVKIRETKREDLAPLNFPEHHRLLFWTDLYQ